jgi:hypothetical protein
MLSRTAVTLSTARRINATSPRICSNLAFLVQLVHPRPLTLVVRRSAGRMQKRGHPAIAVTPVLLRQGDDVVGQRLFVIRPARRLPLRRPVLTQHLAAPSFGHARRGSGAQHG